MLSNLPDNLQQPAAPNRRRFVKDFAAAVVAAATTTAAESAASQQPKKQSARRSCGNQRRWRLAFGLNGFESSEQSFHNDFPIWEVLEFAQREGFEGIEMVPNWPRKGMYLDPTDDRRIASLRGLFAKYSLKIFSIQTFGQEAFQRDRSTRERIGVDRIGYIQFTDTDGTLFHGTSKHLPCGDGHIDVQKSLETLWRGGFEGWFMFDAWDTQNPYDACHKGRLAVEAAQRRLAIESKKAR